MDLDILFVSTEAGELVMKEGSQLIDRLAFKFNKNLEAVLIQTIDKILERNRMDILSLKKMKVNGLLKPESLSYQIAETFIKALKS